MRAVLLKFIQATRDSHFKNDNIWASFQFSFFISVINLQSTLLFNLPGYIKFGLVLSFVINHFNIS